MWNEIKIAGLAFIAFWPLVVLAILLAGRRWPRARAFADKMPTQWKPSCHCADRPRQQIGSWPFRSSGVGRLDIEHRKENNYALRPS